MLCPPICFSCNKRVGVWCPVVATRIGVGVTPGQALTEAGLRRACCRRMLMTSVELISLFGEHEAAVADMTHVMVRKHDTRERRVAIA
jgi:DNA-directed RNA polymerase subunit N (RpoN/RPB10)